jgi:hypothetical protein
MGVIYDPVLDRLRTKDSAGGGGGVYEVVESRTMTGNTSEIFTIGTDDNILFIFESLDFTGTVGAFQAALSLDGGSTYPATHNWVGQKFRTPSVTYVNHVGTTFANISLSGYNIATNGNGFLSLHNITDATDWTTFKSDVGGWYSSSNWSKADLQGGLETNGTPNRILFNSFYGGSTIATGKIHHLKRTI